MIFNQSTRSNENSLSEDAQQLQLFDDQQLLYEYNDVNQLPQNHGNLQANEMNPQANLNLLGTTVLISFGALEIHQLEPSNYTSQQPNQPTTPKRQKQDTLIEDPEYINEIELGSIQRNKAVAAICTILIYFFKKQIEPEICLSLIQEQRSKLRIVGSRQFIYNFQFTLAKLSPYQVQIFENKFSNLILKFNNLMKKDRDNVVFLMEYLKIKCVFDPHLKYKHKSNRLIDKLQQQVLFKYLEYHLVKKEFPLSFRHYQYILRSLLQRLNAYHTQGNEKYLQLELKLQEIQILN